MGTRITAKMAICSDCGYLGDKYSFPQPNDLPDVYPRNPLLKHYYCCCGDCEYYAKDVTGKAISKCKYFDEI